MSSRYSARWFQVIILIFFLGLSFMSFALVHHIAQSRSQENFQVLVDQSLTSFDRRFDEYRRILDGVAGLVMASNLVTAADMSNYVRALNIDDNMFELDALGVASSASTENDLSNNFSTLTDSIDNSSIASAKLQDDRFVVQYIESLAGHEMYLGLDFASNPDLIATAKEAREKRRTLAVTHLPDFASHGRHSRTIILNPIYKHSQITNGLDRQKGDFLGFAFAVLNIDNALKGLTAAQNGLMELKVEYVDQTAHNSLGSLTAATSVAPDYTLRQSVKKFGETFSLSWNSTPQFDSMQPFRARWIVLSLGLLITALVSTILRVLIGNNQTISATVAQKSRDLETQDKEKRSILENAMLAIISVTKSGEILHFNEAALKLLTPQNDRADLKGLSLSDFLPALDIQSTDGWSKLQVASTLENANPWIVEVEKNTWITADGDTRITLMMRDITISERHTQEIAAAEQRWNLALTGARIGVFDIDLRNQTSVVSDTWIETLQIEKLPDCKNPYRHQMDRMHPDDIPLLRTAEAACIEGSSDHATVRFRVKVANDEWRWIQSDSVVVERTSDGTAVRMLGIQMDITESFKLEQLKRDFVATVSHELRTPLTSIKGALGLLQMQLQGVEISSVNRLIQIASSNSDRLVSLVDDILDMEKINADSITHDAKPESLSKIMNLASEHVETYASQWNVNLEVVEPEDEQDIWTDKKRTIQVLTNLLSNACKFAHSDTTVRLTAEFQPNCAKISVSNLGPGIPEEFRGKVFEPFSQADSSDTRQRGGTGLGLNISRQLIESMGGTIGFTSEPDKETIFWFTCPLADASENARVA
jgi:signal transduction histidine kinase/CHASE1-domain containing sensor protein